MSLLPANLVSVVKPYWTPDAAVNRAEENAPTIVTAFFDTQRESWTTRFGETVEARIDANVYLSRFAHLARLKNPMVVFTQAEFAENVLQARRVNGLEGLTTILVIDDIFAAPSLRPALDAIAARMNNPLFQRMLRAPHLPEFRQPRYVFIVTLKFLFVQTAIELGGVATPHVSWVDFGYCRKDGQFDATRPWTFDPKGKVNLFHVLQPDEAPVFAIVRSGEMYFIANHMIAPRQAWAKFALAIATSFDCLLECGLIDDEQTMMLMAWRREPSAYILHPLPPKHWFTTFHVRSDAPVPALPRSRNSARLPLWLEEMLYALARSRTLEVFRRHRRATKRQIRALFRFRAG
jgi:protein YibB